jgi:hypothetical protein
MSEAPARMWREQAVKFLNDRGYPISMNTMNRLCMPAVGKGPRVDVWFAGRPLYLPADLISWAEALAGPSAEQSRLPAYRKSSDREPDHAA